MGATRIQAQGDVVLPVLPDENAVVTNEGATVNNIDGDFTSVTLSPERHAMRMDLTRQLLLQSASNLDAVIQADMANAIANSLDKKIIRDIFSRLASSSKITNGSVTSTTVCTATDFADLTSHEGGFLSQNPAGQNLALLMDPTMAAYLKGVESSAGGQVANLNNNVLGYPVFTSTNVETQSVVAKTYFDGITSSTNTTTIRPVLFLDPSDIFYATFGNLDVTVDPFTSAHTGVVRIIADYFSAGSIRRAGSGRILAGLTANATPSA
jgi:HK97 family phage major capsid protein